MKIDPNISEPVRLRTASEIEQERLEFKRSRDSGYGELFYMAHADGYVMFRRRGDIPETMPEWRWNALPKWKS